jgi:hypothetical protein
LREDHDFAWRRGVVTLPVFPISTEVREHLRDHSSLQNAADQEIEVGAWRPTGVSPHIQDHEEGLRQRRFEMIACNSIVPSPQNRSSPPLWIAVRRVNADALSSDRLARLDIDNADPDVLSTAVGPAS